MSVTEPRPGESFADHMNAVDPDGVRALATMPRLIWASTGPARGLWVVPEDARDCPDSPSTPPATLAVLGMGCTDRTSSSSTAGTASARQHHLSRRGLSLIWSTLSGADVPIITVEDCHKWYELFVVHPCGRVESILFPDVDYAADGESAYRDDAPNPRVVQRFAKAMGYEIDDRALEVMVGRWHIEACGEY